MKRNVFFLAFLFLLFLSGGVEAKKVLKVLAIGNSFSVDAVEQNLYELAAASGDSLVIGNAYIGGCSIDRHWGNAQSGKPEYSYRKIVGGKRTVTPNATLEQMITDEPWDIITLQQASHYSGQIETYNNLRKLADYVRSKARNPKFRFAFHMTWAYAQNSDHGGFRNYGNSQQQMYRAICGAVYRATQQVGISRIIPDGISIQAARTVFGDILCRDGYHLSYDLGRYVAACTWCEFLTGHSVLNNPYHPQNITPDQASKAQQVAHQALKSTRKKLRKAVF